jgi:hypothetical protein
MSSSMYDVVASIDRIIHNRFEIFLVPVQPLRNVAPGILDAQ